MLTLKKIFEVMGGDKRLSDPVVQKEIEEATGIPFKEIPTMKIPESNVPPKMI